MNGKIPVIWINFNKNRNELTNEFFALMMLLLVFCITMVKLLSLTPQYNQCLLSQHLFYNDKNYTPVKKGQATHLFNKWTNKLQNYILCNICFLINLLNLNQWFSNFLTVLPILKNQITITPTMSILMIDIIGTYI